MDRDHHTRTQSPAPTPVAVFDTTLRDGEQSAGIAMSVADKVAVALQLDRLGVDVIEAGFPAASPGDAAAVAAVAGTVERAVVCGLSRTSPGDIESAAAALSSARRSRLHVFIATSDLHLQAKLRMSRDEALAEAVAAVRAGRELFDEVQFSAEDASRSDVAFLIEVFTAVTEAGADVVNVPDTVGHTLPLEFGELVARLRSEVARRSGGAPVWSVHCHDDLGLACANTLAGVAAGARQVEGCINGIGERAGNAALEEVIMALHHRADAFGAIAPQAVTGELAATSALVAEVTGWPVPANKAIVGANAFAHESGIHQHGVLAESATYEIIDPATVGQQRRMVIGKHSGRAAVAERARTLGIDLDGEAVAAVTAQLKDAADRNGVLSAGAIDAIIRRG
jgi:2-isopropylmalate synthase